MTKRAPEYGTFKNGILYARFGEGKRDLLLLSGGPGNGVPRGFGFQMYIRGLRPLLETHTIHLVTRKSGLPDGYTTRDMSDDYAEMIREEFGDHVDLVVGVSFGGMIAQHFAADHAGLFDHIVIAMAAHKSSEAGDEADRRYAELLSQGKERAACATLAEVMYPRGIMKRLMAGLLWMAGGSMLGERSDTFEKDVLIEARAGATHEASDSLRRIEVPVLIACGDADPYFPVNYVQEMANVIERATLKLYPGQGHTIISDRQFGEDVLDFISRQERVRSDGEHHPS